MAGADIRPEAGGLHLVAEGVEHLEGVLGDPDVLLEVELDPHVAIGEHGGCMPIRGVALDDRHSKSGTGPEEVVGGGATHHPTTDDDHVEALPCACRHPLRLGLSGPGQTSAATGSVADPPTEAS